MKHTQVKDVTRDLAMVLAHYYIPEVYGSGRGAWVHGFLGSEEKGFNQYEKTSSCFKYRELGIEARKNYDAQQEILASADGMTTEEAVKYIEHGRELVQMLKGKCHECSINHNHERDKDPHCINICRVPGLLAKMEA
ncbi:MAG: hypothetical protein ACYTEQ_24540 [Planctomycetota bacterium]|jgi:hypothetical protein